MSWLGKLFGGALGFALGGPIGALVGVALGHNLDAGARRHLGELPSSLGGREKTQAAFFSATFSVMGHLAKADGQVSREEIALANRVMDEMQLPNDLRTAARKLFQEGKSPDFPLEDVVDQLRIECHRSTHLAAMFLEILFHAAFADGEIHAGERAVLERVALTLRLRAGELERIESMMRARYAHADHARGASTAEPANESEALAVLGVDASATDSEIKRAYRRLMNQHHPDKLVAKGLPEEMMKLATDRTREIKAAYDHVRRQRGF